MSGKMQTQDRSVLYPGPDDTVVAFFYQGWAEGNFMATVWVTSQGPRMSWRWRYYRDNKVDGSADEKSWYSARGKVGTESKLVVSMMEVVGLHRVRYAPLIHDEIIEVDGPTSKLFELLADKPWAHLSRAQVH